MFLKKGYVLHNRYEIIEKIGAGGMSIVYKAEDLHLKRKVAIKVLRDEFVEDDEFIKRFRREAESVALLNHPNIVNVYDSSVDGDINFIVMEYLNGQNLEEIISKVGKIDVNATLTILYHIADALSYAHKNGIIHRDLKAKNVVINEEGTVKVADFGIAKATSTNTISVATNAIGSVYYYSPEMAKGEECDARSDIYSFGMLGYELLTGKHAFDGDTPVQVALKQVTDETPKPSEICGCSMSVDYLIKKATEKNPKDRYQNAYELIKDIDAILDGKDITKKVQIPERDEVSNFAKILDDYNEARANEERKEHIEETKKEQSKSLDELHKLNAPDPDDEIALMEDGITFKYMNEAERRDIERKEKIDKILNKFKLKKEEKFEEYVSKDDTLIPEENKEDVKKKPGYISLTDIDENMFSSHDESYHNEYESSKEVKKESSSMSARELAAAELFDNREDDDKKKKQFEKDIKENVSKPEKKKKSLRDFFTIDVDEEDEFEEEKDLKHEEDKMAKGRDDYGYISKDDDKQVVKAAIYTSLVIIFFILIGMIRYMMYLYDNRLVEVPELVGEVYEEVAEQYKKQGIQIEVIGEEVNMRYAKGVIISQENDPGSKMNRKNVIGVVLSKGKSGSVMPDLISRTVEEAKDALEKYEVSILVSEEASNDVVEGYIARTEPACDEPIRQGMTVTLYLSTGGDSMFTVPDLTGMTEKEAKAALEKVGLKLGNVVYRDGSNESNGVVTSQTELANTKLDEDAEVGIGLDVKSNDEPAQDTKPKDEDNKPQEETKPQQPANDNVLVSAKVVAQSWMVDGQSYVVEIRIDDNPEYRQKINKADFPITQKFNAKKGSTLTVYIDGKYITDKICE